MLSRGGRGKPPTSVVEVVAGVYFDRLNLTLLISISKPIFDDNIVWWFLLVDYPGLRELGHPCDFVSVVVTGRRPTSEGPTGRVLLPLVTPFSPRYP